jgi:hypothetical protein
LLTKAARAVRGTLIDSTRYHIQFFSLFGSSYKQHTSSMMIHRITINLFLALAAADFAAAFVLPTAIVPKARDIQSLTATADEGAFEYNANVAGKGKLVVSFEPFSDEPTPTPKPTPPTPPNESFTGVKLPENEEPPQG